MELHKVSVEAVTDNPFPVHPSTNDSPAEVTEAAAAGPKCTSAATMLTNVPAETGGVALALTGLGNALGPALALLHPALARASLALRGVCNSLCALLMLLVLLKLLLRPRVVQRELRQPKTCSSYGGLLMAIVGTSASLSVAGLRCAGRPRRAPLFRQSASCRSHCLRSCWICTSRDLRRPSQWCAERARRHISTARDWACTGNGRLRDGRIVASAQLGEHELRRM